MKKEVRYLPVCAKETTVENTLKNMSDINLRGMDKSKAASKRIVEMLKKEGLDPGTLRGYLKITMEFVPFKE